MEGVKDGNNVGVAVGSADGSTVGREVGTRDGNTGARDGVILGEHKFIDMYDTSKLAVGPVLTHKTFRYRY